MITLISALGALVANVATNGCLIVWFDEPKMPKSMLEK